MRTAALLLLSSLALSACDPSAPRSAAGSAAESARDAARAAKAATAEGQKLNEIAERYYEQYLELHPLTATAQGDHRFDARLGDYVSPTWMADWLAIEQEALQALAAVKPARLGGDDLVTYEAFKYGREVTIAGFRYPSELLPLQPFGGLHTQFALLGSGAGAHPFRTVQDYDNFLRRMDGFVEWVDQSINNMRTGAAKGFVQPRVVVERVIAQLATLGVADPGQSVLWRPLTKFPASVPVADRDRLVQAWRDKLGKRVLPAYRRLHDFLQDEYLAQARPTVAWSELPNGADWYSYLVRLHTTTRLMPDEVHELGLREVERIRGEMERVRRQLGHHGDLPSLFDALRADANQYYTNPEDLLAGYRALQTRVDAAMPLLFARVPATRLQVRAVEEFRATSEAAGSYAPGSADGKRVGMFYVNTSDLPSRPKHAMEPLYLHAAVPGHHYQVSLAQEATGLPRIRRFAWDTAYRAGWASYAESLGSDLGLYADPYGVFGALSADMRRAVLLVVDTGLHAKGWTRERAIDYFRANTALGEADSVAEVDRCIAMPGQALADKIGQLKIQELRRRAEQALGPRFDVRAFHGHVVDGGSLPLAVLDAKVDRWLRSLSRPAG